MILFQNFSRKKNSYQKQFLIRYFEKFIKGSSLSTIPPASLCQEKIMEFYRFFQNDKMKNSNKKFIYFRKPQETAKKFSSSIHPVSIPKDLSKCKFSHFILLNIQI